MTINRNRNSIARIVFPNYSLGMWNTYSKRAQKVVLAPLLAVVLLAFIDVFQNEAASTFIDLHLSPTAIWTIYVGIFALNLYALIPFIPDILRGEFHLKLATTPDPIKRIVAFVTGVFFGPALAFASFAALYQQELPTAVCFFLAFIPVFSTAISLSFWIRLLAACFYLIAALVRK